MAQENSVHKLGFSCILIFLFALKALDQYDPMEFDHYSPNEGLSFGFTNCVFQDSKGFIWVGTGNGLNRFDGIIFKVYLYDSKISKSLSGNVVMAITEDTLKNMWIATSNGLDLYDRTKDSFSKKIFRVKNQIYDRLALTTCYIDSRGYMWVGVYRSIFRFKLYNNPQIYNDTIDAERYVLEEEDVPEANKTTFYAFVEDEKQRIWVASHSQNLFSFNEKKKVFIPHLIQHPSTKSYSNTQKKMIKDQDGDFIITIEFNGIVVWDRKNDKFRLYSPNDKNTGPNDDLLFGITQAKDGLIWFGSRNKGGVNIFDKKTGLFTYHVSDPANPYSLSTNSVVCFYEDRSGSMWIGVGAGKGLERYCPYKKKFNRYFAEPSESDHLSSNNILCFAENKSGDIWIGTDGSGLNKLNKKTGKYQRYIHNPDIPNSLSSNSIISMCIDHEDVLWIATFNGGLCKLKDNQFTTYKPNPEDPFSIVYQHIWYVYEDSKNNMWIASLNRGIELFDKKNNRFYLYTFKEGDSTSLMNNASFQIFEDSRQNIYITSYNGVSIFNLNDYDFSKMPPDLKFRQLFHKENSNSLSSNIVYCVAEDKKGNIWFGTQATGLDKMDPKTGKFTNYSTNEGLPGNSISSILIDNKNLLWLATDKGLTRFNPETGDVYVFDNHDGLQNKNLIGWAIKTKDGEMYFGGPDGFNSFFPDSIQYNNNIPPVIITGLKLFNHPVGIGEVINERTLLKNDISATDELIFKYYEDYITIEFVALDYTLPQKNNYAYIMKGFDKDWINCGTKREANYTNLDPGDYTFMVKASNNDGVWNETGATMRIIILPPWWKTWWFRVLFIILIISAIVGFIYYRMANIRNLNIKLRKLVVERTKVIELKNRVLEEQSEMLNETNTLLEERQQRIEEQAEELQTTADELAEKNDALSTLNATKDKFFTIIAHDLKNPFNAILGFSELLTASYDKYDDVKRKTLINTIFDSSKKIYKLLENLLQWARSQTGSIEFKMEEFYLSEIIDSNIFLVENLLKEKNLALSRLDDDNIKAYADKNMINTVLRNLISNAIKFNENGTISIECQQNNSTVTIKIKDTGIGINQEKLKDLFNVTASKSTYGTKGESGTGLGLILCKEFIEKNNGIIGAESEEGKGSTFWFTLPVA